MLVLFVEGSFDRGSAQTVYNNNRLLISLIAAINAAVVCIRQLGRTSHPRLQLPRVEQQEVAAEGEGEEEEEMPQV